jgi:hypothetical protein
MGLDITVLMVDWKRLGECPIGERIELLWDAAFPGDIEEYPEVEKGWVWPSGTGEPWFAMYEFPHTLGSYKPHHWAGSAWDDVRDFAEPPLRAALDVFVTGLLWDGSYVDDGMFPSPGDRWRPHLLVCRPPETVPPLLESWSQAAPLLDGIREPYAQHAACPGRWIANFEEFSELLHGWGEVVGEVTRRGWGLVGLPG